MLASTEESHWMTDDLSRVEEWTACVEWDNENWPRGTEMRGGRGVEGGRLRGGRNSCLLSFYLAPPLSSLMPEEESCVHLPIR